jgi:heme/copper-type cytochrome/quinol oxidase subunit 1
VQALQAQHLLLAACSAKAAEAVAVATLALVVLAVLEAVALAAAVAVLAAAHTQQVLAGLVVLAGLWFWSFDHAAICSC